VGAALATRSTAAIMATRSRTTLTAKAQRCRTTDADPGLATTPSMLPPPVAAALTPAARTPEKEADLDTGGLG